MIEKIYSLLPPLVAGIAMAKTALLLAGVLVFFLLPNFVSDLDPFKHWALVFWYPTIAGVSAASSVADQININFMRPPWWLRTPLIGAWLNLIVVIFATGVMQDFSLVVIFSFGLFTSQYWFVADGAILGLIAGFIAHRTKMSAFHYRSE